jgi:hypothetical protein
MISRPQNGANVTISIVHLMKVAQTHELSSLQARRASVWARPTEAALWNRRCARLGRASGRGTLAEENRMLVTQL